VQFALRGASQRSAEGQSGAAQPDACKQPLHLATREAAQRAGHRLHPEQEQPDAARYRQYVRIIARYRPGAWHSHKPAASAREGGNGPC